MTVKVELRNLINSRLIRPFIAAGLSAIAGGVSSIWRYWPEAQEEAPFLWVIVVAALFWVLVLAAEVVNDNRGAKVLTRLRYPEMHEEQVAKWYVRDALLGKLVFQTAPLIVSLVTTALLHH